MRISFCGTTLEPESKSMKETIKSIKAQSIKVNKIITVFNGNIAQARNKYLESVEDDIIFTFDSGCFYEKNYIKKMLECFKDKQVDIVMGVVLPMKPTSLIQEFCATRIPQYYRFTEKDWNTFVPSNRQVAFRKEVITKLGYLPEDLSRADDTYWYGLARKKGLKFAHCNAIVYWETKKTLKDYLKTVYKDEKFNKKYDIRPANMPNKINPMLFPYGCFVCFLAMINKFIGGLGV